MSRSSRRAIAGTASGEREAAANAAEAGRQLDACRTPDDVRAVLAWAKGRAWLLTPGDDFEAMRAAFERARGRVNQQKEP